jgi:hypothetical protein
VQSKHTAPLPQLVGVLLQPIGWTSEVAMASKHWLASHASGRPPPPSPLPFPPLSTPASPAATSNPASVAPPSSRLPASPPPAVRSFSDGHPVSARSASAATAAATVRPRTERHAISKGYAPAPPNAIAPSSPRFTPAPTPALSPMVAAGRRLLVFHDWEHMHGYDPEAKRVLTEWSQRIMPHWDASHILFSSQIIAMAVSVANLDARGKAKNYSSRKKWEAALAAACASRGTGEPAEG